MQENDKGKESALYYLSRMMTPNEVNYSSIEKLCPTLNFCNSKVETLFSSPHIEVDFERKSD